MEMNIIYNEDCLEGMKRIEDKSIDMILCDLPYGTTRCKWDTIIPFEPLWEQYERIIKDNGAIVLTSSQPFTSALVMSKPNLFRYEWIWDKVQPTGALQAKKMPMKLHENVLVFYKKSPIYNRQMTERDPKDVRKNAVRNKLNQKTNLGYDHIGGKIMTYSDDYDPTKVNPKTIIRFSKQPKRVKNLHPTQKPVALFDYLIKTYSNNGDLVLDNCIGSGTTAISAMNTGRNFIGFELDEEYFNIACNRIEEHKVSV